MVPNDLIKVITIFLVLKINRSVEEKKETQNIKEESLVSFLSQTNSQADKSNKQNRTNNLTFLNVDNFTLSFQKYNPFLLMNHNANIADRRKKVFHNKDKNDKKSVQNRQKSNVKDINGISRITFDKLRKRKQQKRSIPNKTENVVECISTTQGFQNSFTKSTNCTTNDSKLLESVKGNVGFHNNSCLLNQLFKVTPMILEDFLKSDNNKINNTLSLKVNNSLFKTNNTNIQVTEEKHSHVEHITRITVNHKPIVSNTNMKGLDQEHSQVKTKPMIQSSIEYKLTASDTNMKNKEEKHLQTKSEQITSTTLENKLTVSDINIQYRLGKDSKINKLPFTLEHKLTDLNSNMQGKKGNLSYIRAKTPSSVLGCKFQHSFNYTLNSNLNMRAIPLLTNCTTEKVKKSLDYYDFQRIENYPYQSEITDNLMVGHNAEVILNDYSPFISSIVQNLSYPKQFNIVTNPRVPTTTPVEAVESTNLKYNLELIKGSTFSQSIPVKETVKQVRLSQPAEIEFNAQKSLELLKPLLQTLEISTFTNCNTQNLSEPNLEMFSEDHSRHCKPRYTLFPISSVKQKTKHDSIYYAFHEHEMNRKCRTNYLRFVSKPTTPVTPNYILGLLIEEISDRLTLKNKNISTKSPIIYLKHEKGNFSKTSKSPILKQILGKAVNNVSTVSCVINFHKFTTKPRLKISVPVTKYFKNKQEICSTKPKKPILNLPLSTTTSLIKKQTLFTYGQQYYKGNFSKTTKSHKLKQLIVKALNKMSTVTSCIRTHENTVQPQLKNSDPCTQCFNICSTKPQEPNTNLPLSTLISSKKVIAGEEGDLQTFSKMSGKDKKKLKTKQRICQINELKNILP